MKTAYATSIITGSILILGAAGGCDFGSTSLGGAILLILCGLALCLFGLLTPKYTAKFKRSRHFPIRKVRSKSVTSKQKRIAAANEITEARKNFVLIKEI